MATITMNTHHNAATSAADHIGNNNNATQSIWRQIRNSSAKLVNAYIIWEERRALRKLSDDVLKDIGLSRSDVNKECSRSFFDTPTNRK